MEQIDFIYRKLSDTELPTAFEDSENIYNESTWKIDVLKTNPALGCGEDTVFQILGTVNNNIVGSEVHFPIVLQLGRERYRTVSGHGLSVSSKFRGLGLGTKLTDQRLDFSDTHSLLLCDASMMHLPILRKLGAIVFLMPRMIMLKHSFSVIENKTNKFVAKGISPLVDLALKIPTFLIKKKLKKVYGKLDVRELPTVTDEIESVLLSDNHRFKEIHSKEWFEWVLKNSLVKDDSLSKKIFGVYDENRLVGFFMTKQRFYKQASHRGYKNVMMGSIMEWGTTDKNVITDTELCLLALLSFDDSVDAIELCCPDDKFAHGFKKFGLMQIGSGNVVVRFRDNSPLKSIDGLNEQSNWRLRPAMGDNSLS